MEGPSGSEVTLEADREEGEPEAKKRRLLCVEFASVARCDSAVAQCYLAENDWEMEVGFAPLSPLYISAREAPRSHRCVCFSESAELVLRAASGEQRLGKPP